MDTADVKHVVEHGMGMSSTPMFHSMDLRTYLSFEDDPRWARCPGTDGWCSLGSVHSIVAFDESYVGRIAATIIDPDRSLVLVDGPGPQRGLVAEACMERFVLAIVEHDAETFITDDVELRRAMCEKFGYASFQYVATDPEVAIYVRNDAVRTLGRIEVGNGTWVML